MLSSKPSTPFISGLFQGPTLSRDTPSTPRVDPTEERKPPLQLALATRPPSDPQRLFSQKSSSALPTSVGASPFIEMGSHTHSSPHLVSRHALTTQVASRIESSPSSMRDTAQSYLDRLKKDGDVIARIWLRAFVSVPSDSVQPRAMDSDTARTLIDARLHGQNDAKEALIDELLFWQKTGINRFKVCLQGPPGVGKTCLLKSLGEIFKRPVITLNMDSIGDETSLVGHAPSYQGNNLGVFLNALIQSGCKNPIIFIDEIDKIKQDASGWRILDLLNQWLDDERSYFDSAYLGLRIDLSQCAFVIAGNDMSRIATYGSLFDRMQPIIEMDGYDAIAQRTIFLENMLPGLNQELPEENRVTFSDSATETLIEGYGRAHAGERSGVRALKDWGRFIVKKAVARNKRQVAASDVTAALRVLFPKKIN